MKENKTYFKIDRGHFHFLWNQQKNISVQTFLTRANVGYLCIMFINVPIPHFTSGLSRRVMVLPGLHLM